MDIETPSAAFWEFQAYEQEKEARIAAYLDSGRRKVSLTTAHRLERKRQAAKFLYATNSLSRLNFARIADRELSRVFASEKQTVWLVSFAFRKHCCPLSQGALLDIKSLQALIRQILDGLHFIGMIEVAYYSNVRLDPTSSEGTVCFHVHAALVQVDGVELNRRLSPLLSRYKSLLPGIPSVDWRQVKSGDETRVFLYALKSPAHEYRVIKQRGEQIDFETGEVLQALPWQQAKRRLRPGDLVRVRSALVGRYIDQMALAGGSYRPILHRIRTKALRAFHDWNRRNDARRHRRRRFSQGRTEAA